ncbi:MAG: hypothetical protein U0930_23765 [Pirellulales bacterium]
MSLRIRLPLVAFLLWTLNLAVELPTASAFQEAKKPTAPKLFPDSTLAYFRIADIKQLKKDLEKSSIGKMSNDEQIKPIIGEFYGTFVKSTEQLVNAIGLDLNQLLAIPSGEMAVGMFAPARQTRAEREAGEPSNQPPVIFAVMLDAGDEISNIQVLLKRMEEAVGENAPHREKSLDRLTLHSYTNNDRADQQFAYFIDGGTIVGCNSLAYIEDLAQVWLGKGGDRKTLADNSKFVTIMSRCVGTEGERPQISFYADPLGMIREFTPKNPGTAMFLGLLSPLGLDGVEAMGGSWIVSPPDFDAIGHFHVSLSSPRREILALLRPKSGAVVPEAWVPSSSASYMTVNWDIQSTYTAVERLFNRFQGKDALEQKVFAGINKQLDIDVKKDVLDNLEGRLTMVQGFVRPITVNSGSNVYAIRLKNPKHIENNVLPKVLKSFGERVTFTSEAFGKIKAQVMAFPQREGRQNAPIQIRTPEICIAIVDDYLVISDSRYMMREMADALGDSSNQLRESIEFQLINDRIKAQVQQKEASGISFARPEESLQLFYELARDSKNKDALKQYAAMNPIFTALNETLQKHELPPFSVISKYLVPSGGFLVDEELGLHYTTFSLKRE